VKPERGKLLKFYRTMLKIRRFEERAVQISKFSDNIKGVLNTYDGQEAVAVGVCANLRKDDYIFGTHRSDGHLIAMGGDVGKMMAELFGKRTGYCQGRGGQMHFQAPKLGFVTASGIVGDSIPMATGAGLSIKIRMTDQVAVAFFGDGASNTGAFHEGINMASAWKLPVLFVCENNLFAVSTKVTEATAIKNLADRAKGYGIPGIIVNGMDVIKVYQATGEALARARGGGEPTLLECKTYRFVGHSAMDPGDGMMYKDKKEEAGWRKKCPIKWLEERLKREKILSDERITKIEEEVKKELDKAEQFAQESEFPAREEIMNTLFS